MLKKLFCLILSILVSVFTLTLFACNNEKQVINVYAVDGAPLLSVCSLLNVNEIKAENKTYQVKVNVVSGVDAIKGAISRKEADLAVCPINLAAALYNGGVDYRLLSVSVLNSLTLIGNEQISVLSLKGQTVYNTGMGGTPDVCFKALLNSYGLEYTENLSTAQSDKVNIKYVQTNADIVALLNSNVAKFALIGEPFASNLLSKNYKKILNLNDEWKLKLGANVMQAGIIVNNERLTSDCAIISELVKILKQNESFFNSNYQNLPTILKQNGSNLTFTYDLDSYKNWQLTFDNPYIVKNELQTYLTVLKNNAPSSIGGKLPNDNFYLDYENL